jgi:hypothetical protein
LRELFFALLFTLGPAVVAQTKYSVDTGECGGAATARAAVYKTKMGLHAGTGRRAYGVLEYRRSAEDVKAKRCSVIYRLMVVDGQREVREMKHLIWKTEEGEIAGIDLVGFSPDGSKFVADFWLAEGDGTEHRIALLDLREGSSWFRSLSDVIYKRSNNEHVDMENYYETLDLVRNDGRVWITAHADGGSKRNGVLSRWLFDPMTGSVTKAPKN